MEIQQLSIVSLRDHYMIGSAASGADFAQNMFGMYIRFEQGIAKVSRGLSNMAVSAKAAEWKYKPLRATSLRHAPVVDHVSASDLLTMLSEGQAGSDQMIHIERDYKDVMVHVWQQWSPESTWEEYCESNLGWKMIQRFIEDSRDIPFGAKFSYEQMVSSPQQFMMDLVDHLLPRENNPNDSMFGAPFRKIDMNAIDKVVQESFVRDMRSDSGSNCLERVGIWKDFITVEQAQEVDEFVASI